MSGKRKPLSQLPQGQSLSKRLRNNGNVAPDPNCQSGFVKRMVLRNFMCHSLLEVQFEHSINFIIGQNGSGKSAILTALVVGLGAKANSTNRGSSIKGFIKAGETSASVEIVLNNSGPMAYKPDEYGEQITIIRSFSASGSSGYRIKSSTGSTISTKARDVLLVTASLNIQVDNPVCILNQDTSRNFLSNADPKTKFDLFVRATRLETLENEYKHGVQDKHVAERNFRDKKKVLTDLEKELVELKEKINSHGRVYALEDELNQVKSEKFWSEVADIEAQLAEKQNTIDALKTQCEELRESVNGRDDVMSKLVDDLREVQEQLNEIKRTAEQQDQPIDACNAKLGELRLQADKKRREKEVLKRDNEKKERSKQSVRQEIDTFTARMSQLEQRRLENVRKIKELESDFKKVQEQEEMFSNEAFQCQGDVQMREQAVSAVREELEDNKSKSDRIQMSMNSLRNEAGNPLAVYGRDMVALVQDINANQHVFSEKPRGPIGSYISLKDKKWTYAVESFIGKSRLYAFCVNNAGDSAKLMKLIEKHFPGRFKPMIITSKFFHKVHNVSKNLVRKVGQCVSIFEQVKVSDPVVMNCLIDQLAVEGVLLIPDDEQAMELMSDRNRVPKNCARAIVTNGDQYYPDPNYKTYPSRYPEARYLQVDTEDILRQYNNSLIALREKRNELETRYSHLRAELENRRKAQANLQENRNKCAHASKIIRERIGKLKSTDESSIGNIDQLEEDFRAIEASIRENEDRLAAIDGDVKGIDMQIQDMKDQLERLRQSNRAFERRVIPLEEKASELMNKRKRLETSKESDKRLLKQKELDIKEAKVELTEHEKMLRNKLQDETYGNTARYNSIRPMRELTKEIDRLERKLVEFRASMESIDTLMETYKGKVTIYNKLCPIITHLESNLEELTKAYRYRKCHYRSTKEYFKNFVSYSFRTFLKIRQFQGEINIDFDEKKLEMIVMPQEGSKTVTKTSNLSGGERSFSTVAFLYSLWQCLNFPFYFLDEFDVFMDKVNRTKVMEILIHHAKEHKNKQFVFLTPQDTSFVADDEVDIHKLEDPIRRHTQ